MPCALRKRYGRSWRKPMVPTHAIVSKQDMAKGYFKVAVLDAEGREVDVVESVQSKKLAQEHADEINKQGWYSTGISGRRYRQQLGHVTQEPQGGW
jgi:hypothetical protein